MALIRDLMPQPIIKTEDDEEITDLDSTRSAFSDGPLIRWHKHVTALLKECYKKGSAKELEEHLKFYKRSLLDQLNCLNNVKLLKEKMLIHLRDIENCYCGSALFSVLLKNYYEYIVDILSEYVNLELEILKSVRKNDMLFTEYEKLIKITSLNICKVLHTYVHNDEERLMHVLLKIRFKKSIIPCRDLMHKIYTHFLIDLPVIDLSDKAFCRNYLVLENWKEILRRTQHGWMDKALTRKFKQDDDYIRRNETLKLIKKQKPKTISTIFNQIMDCKLNLTQAYFDYIKRKRDECESCMSTLLAEDKKACDCPYFSNASNSTKSNNTISSGELFEEEDNRCIPNNIFDDDDDDIIINEQPINPCKSKKLPILVCLSDDSDIEEIVYLDTGRKNTSKNKQPVVYIDLLGDDSSDESVEPISQSIETSQNVQETSQHVKETSQCVEEMPKCTEQNLQSVKETPQCTKETPQQMLVMPPQDVEMPKNIEETSQCVEEMSQNIAETSPCVEEMRQIIEETSKNVEEILQNIEEVPQNIEETSQYVEELAPCVQERHPVDQRTDNNSSAEINISSNEINHEKITYSESSTLMDEDIVKNSESVTVKNTAKVNECETFSNSKANEIEETCSQSIQCEMQTTISAAGPNSNIVMNNVLNDLTNNNVKENKSNLVDAGIQTEPLVCVYDTPPSEQQFDAKSPDCLLPSTNKYFEKSTMNYEINTLVARSITEDEQLNFDGASSADSEPTDMEALKDQTALSIEMDEHTHIDRNISESDKENSYDLENAENSDFDIEEYDVQLHTSIDITNEHIDEESQDDSILQTESQPIKVVIGKVMSIPEAEFESHRDVEFLNNEEDKHGNDTYVESEENPEDDEQRSSDHTEAFKSVTQDLNDHSFSTLQDYNSSSNLEASHSSSESSPEIESETITNLDGNVQIENNLLNNFKSVLNNNCNTLIEKDNENENNRVTKNKIMYSSSQTITTCESFESFYKDNLINNVSETFKEAFSGPLSKLNGTTLMANGNFDLFDGLQKQPLTAELGIKTKIPEGISPKANSNTETNSSEASSPNDTSPLYQNLDKVDIESHFMNMQFDDEMRNFFKVGESKPKTKRVAISEEKNIFYKDHRTAEDMENIYGKRRKIHPVRSKRNEPEIKYNDEKLQKQPIVRLEYFTEAQLWKKYQEELAMAMLERAMSARKHNTTKSCIVLRYNYKKGQENNEDMMPQQNYVFEGSTNVLDSNKTKNFYKNNVLGRKKTGRGRGRGKGRPPRTNGRNLSSEELLSLEFDRLKETESYRNCSYKDPS